MGISLLLLVSSFFSSGSEGEDLLRLVERHIRNQSSEGLALQFTSDYEGDGFLSAPPSSCREERFGPVRVRTWEEPSPNQKKSSSSFLRQLHSVTDVRVRFLSQEGTEGTIRIQMTGTASSGIRFDRTEIYHAGWTKNDAGTSFFSVLKRISGRWVESSRTLFQDCTDLLGVRFSATVQREDLPVFMEPFSFLGGIAAGDFDQDGDLDLYVPRVGKNILYRKDGEKFVPVLGDGGVGSAALFVDLDNDGWLDLLLSNLESKKMPSPQGLQPNPSGRALVWYRNKGDGQFEDRTEASGLKTQGPAMSLTASDIDRDGDLDFYVCFYKDFGAEVETYVPIPEDILQAENGVENQLWINQGDGTFQEEAAKRGVADPGWSFAASFADYDNDGDPDLSVANDFGQNRLYRNRGDGTFEEVSLSSGTTDPGFGMGVSWGDVNGDGRLDLYVSNMYSTAGNRLLTSKDDARLHKMARGNTLLLNGGESDFEDVSGKAGVARGGWAWSNAFLDYNADGHPDLHVANGYMTGESELDL